MNARESIGSILVILAAGFTVCLSAVMVRRIRAVALKDTYARAFRCELIACAVFLLLALDVRFGIFTIGVPGALRAAGWILRAAVILAAAVFLTFIGRITVGGLIRTAAPARNAIVLGLALENGRPANDLIARLDAAEAYARENPDAALILTGGNPDSAGRTEAAVMREILLERGIAEERMILEDQAETTRENFRNTARMVDPREPIVLISSDYHMDRAVQAAKRAGFARVLRLPAPSSFIAFGANVMWEAIMEVNELLLRR